jgi:hypothetical protein
MMRNAFEYSGPNEHMTGLSTSLSDYHSVDTPHSVTFANGSLSHVAIRI